MDKLRMNGLVRFLLLDYLGVLVWMWLMITSIRLAMSWAFVFALDDLRSHFHRKSGILD